MLKPGEIAEHYNRPEIKEAIIRLASSGNLSRAGCGDRVGWYWPNRKDKRMQKYNLADSNEYDRIVSKHYRVIYSTLNLFDIGICHVDFSDGKIQDSPGISRKFTRGYTFGIDIDKEHGKDIHDPEVKKAVEDMAQFYVDYLKGYGMDNYINVAFSGGGIYILLHHMAVSQYFDEYSSRKDWDKLLFTLLDAFDALILEIRDNFFIAHPEHVGKVKPDALNGSQRIFKSLFSIHAKYDYAVVPLDPADIKINFDDAKLPIKPDVIESAKTWYCLPDGLDCRLESGYFLTICLCKHLQAAYSKKCFRPIVSQNIDISKVPLADTSKWAPCMRNLYNLPECGEGATRALAVFASFIGQIGISENGARDMFFDLAYRWGAKTSNIFESYYLKMKTPLCDTLRSNDNRGFPKGMSIKNLGVCKPDARCMQISSPRYHTDKTAQADLYKALISKNT